MKKSIKITAVISALCIVFAFSAIAFADQENELDIPHDHEYTVLEFENGVAFCECEICDSTVNESFEEHINDREDLTLDMNGDGIVNAKDYAMLIKTF